MGVYHIMKNAIFISFLTILTFACSKSNDTQTTNPLSGTWNLVSVTGGIAGKGYPANFDAIKFDDQSFDLVKSKSSIYKGTYSTTPDQVNPTAFNITSSEESADYFLLRKTKTIHFEKDKLILSDPCCDLYNYEFTKSLN